MTIYRQQMDELVVMEMCNHDGTLVVDHENDVIRCSECECAWWPIRDWEGGWLGTHTRFVSISESQEGASV